MHKDQLLEFLEVYEVTIFKSFTFSFGAFGSRWLGHGFWAIIDSPRRVCRGFCWLSRRGCDGSVEELGFPTVLSGFGSRYQRLNPARGSLCFSVFV